MHGPLVRAPTESDPVGLVSQILVIDSGIDIVPALASYREPVVDDDQAPTSRPRPGGV